MKFLFQILLLFLTWLTNLSAIPLFTKVAFPNYEVAFSNTENVNEESIVKIGIQNFARSGISEKSDTLNATLRENYVLEKSRARMSGEVVNGAGNRFIRSIDDFKLNDVADLKEDIKHFDVLNKS